MKDVKMKTVKLV